MDLFRRTSGDHRSRRGLLLFVVFQLLVAVGLPAADAVLEAASVGTPTHVEAPTDEACGNPHDHLFCQLCRTLGLSVLPGSVSAGDDLVRTGPVHVAGTPSFARPSGTHLAGSLSARGPPRA